VSHLQSSNVGVVREPASAAALLHPVRQSILEALREPGSATTLAPRLGLPRQKVNYHLRELEKHDLVELVRERRKGNCTERVLRAKAHSYVISPETVATLAADPAQIRDRFSSAYLAALASRTLGELGRLRSQADRAKKRLATLSLESELRFASPQARAAFGEELAAAVAELVEKYHDPNAETGRSFRMVVGVYPHPKSKELKKAGDGKRGGRS
jgi:DNA-binding transcriptional ArsR family regulator